MKKERVQIPSFTQLRPPINPRYNGKMDTVDKIIADIKSLKIQGATNVALAVLDALAQIPSPTQDIARRLAYARPTEPLAQNAIRYVFSNTAPLLESIQQYKSFIDTAQKKIVENGSGLFVDGGRYLTLCHSSTTVALFGSAKQRFSVYVAETRPLFQGRITATELLKHGLTGVTMVVDTVAIALLEEQKIDAVFLGADLLSDTGFVNKVGSLAAAATAHRRQIPVFVISTLLKFDPHPFVTEMRDSKEIWPDAPAGLKFYTPAFDFVPYSPNIKLVCETGILTCDTIKNAVQTQYPFIFHGESLS